MTMQISLGLPTFLAHDRALELSWYRTIDQGPWSGMVFSDGITFPNSWSLTVQLSAAAAMTERVKLSTAIATLPLRNPVLFAKELATIDVLSGGRLVVGVGIGGLQDDYLATGGDLALRHQRMDDHVATMQKVWRQEPLVEGQFPVGPKPLQPSGIPLLAGASGPKALARAAKWASGVIDAGATIAFDKEALAAQKACVVQAWKDAGRDDTPYFAACMYFALGPNAKEQLGDYMFHMSHSYGEDAAREAAQYVANYGADRLRDAVAGAREIGLDELMLLPTTPDVTEIDRVREILGV